MDADDTTARKTPQEIARDLGLEWSDIRDLALTLYDFKDRLDRLALEAQRDHEVGDKIDAIDLTRLSEATERAKDVLFDLCSTAAHWGEDPEAKRTVRRNWARREEDE
jgi:hypothetical protein